MIFKNRTDAGIRLAASLSEYAGTDSIVIAIPRGGVVIGCEVARALGLPLDVVVPRKIGAPGQPEYGIGAVAGEDICVLDESVISYLHVSDQYIKEESERQRKEIGRRVGAYRKDRPPLNLTEKTAILVDDGIATGYTTLAAMEEVRRKSPKKLVLAVPVAPPEVLDRLRTIADELVVLETPDPFYAVGSWYQEFDQVSDEEVIRLLAQRPA